MKPSEVVVVLTIRVKPSEKDAEAGWSLLGLKKEVAKTLKKAIPHKAARNTTAGLVASGLFKNRAYWLHRPNGCSFDFWIDEETNELVITEK